MDTPDARDLEAARLAFEAIPDSFYEDETYLKHPAVMAEIALLNQPPTAEEAEAIRRWQWEKERKERWLQRLLADPIVQDVRRSNAIADEIRALKPDISWEELRIAVDSTPADYEPAALEPVVDVRELLALPVDDADPTYSRLNVVDLADVMLNGVTDPVMLVDGLLVAGCSNVWYGQKECGKTWLVLWVVKQLLQRGETIVYVDKEMGRAFIAARLDTLGVEPELVRDRLVYLEMPTLDNSSESLTEWRQLLEDRDPALIVVDAQMEVLADADLNENSTSDVLKWLSWYFEPARRLDITTLMLDHTGHETAGRPRGASGKGQAAKAELEFTKTPFDRTRVGKLKVTSRKNTVAAAIPAEQWFAIGGTDEGFILERIEPQLPDMSKPLAGDGDSELAGRLLKRLRDVFETERTGLSGKQLRDTVTGGNQAIQRELAGLVEDGTLLATAGRNGGTDYQFNPARVDLFVSPYYVGGEHDEQVIETCSHEQDEQVTNTSNRSGNS